MRKKKWKPYYNKAMQNEDEVFLKLVKEKVIDSKKKKEKHKQRKKTIQLEGNGNYLLIENIS